MIGIGKLWSREVEGLEVGGMEVSAIPGQEGSRRKDELYNWFTREFRRWKITKKRFSGRCNWRSGRVRGGKGWGGRERRGEDGGGGWGIEEDDGVGDEHCWNIDGVVWWSRGWKRELDNNERFYNKFFNLRDGITRGRKREDSGTEILLTGGCSEKI